MNCFEKWKLTQKAIVGLLTMKCRDVLDFNNGLRDLQLDNGGPGGMIPNRQYVRLILEP